MHVRKFEKYICNFQSVAGGNKGISWMGAGSKKRTTVIDDTWKMPTKFPISQKQR